MTDGGSYWTTAFKRPYSRRTFLRTMAGVGAGVIGLSASGCGEQKPSAPVSVSKSPKYGGIFNFLTPGPLPNLDPYDTSKSIVAQRAALGTMYDRLVDFDWADYAIMADLKIIPRLAESWTMPDATTYVFKLRQGVKWHDGTEFSSADVKFSFDFLMDPQNALPGRGILAPVSKLEAPDKNTIKITLKRPSAAFISTLTNDGVNIAPKHLLEKERDKLAMKPVGTGPFMIEKFEPDIKVTYKKNPNYWVQGKPYVDGMTQALISDWSAKAAAFMSKQVDVHIVTDTQQIEGLKVAVPDMQVRDWPTPMINHFVYNYPRPPFNDIRVRKAVQLAVDHKGLLDRLYGGKGIVNPPVMSANWKKWAMPQDELLKIPGFRPSKDGDLAEAKRLLAEAGYANGLQISAICNATLSTTPKALTVVAEQMRAVGITVSIECAEPGTFTNRERKSRDFDIDFTPFAGMYEDPDNRYLVSIAGNGSSNWGQLKDQKLDEMIEKQGQALDEQERRKIIVDIQRYMIEQAYHTPTPDSHNFCGMHPYVRGYNPAYTGTVHPHFRGSVEDIWFDK